jgi:multisubunit Na+/H+ antiporter MnhC subunit
MISFTQILVKTCQLGKPIIGVFIAVILVSSPVFASDLHRLSILSIVDLCSGGEFCISIVGLLCSEHIYRVVGIIDTISFSVNLFYQVSIVVVDVSFPCVVRVKYTFKGAQAVVLVFVDFTSIVYQLCTVAG